MSTKIHSGLRFSSRSLLKVHEQLMGFRPTLRALQREGLVRWIALSSQRLADRRSLGLAEPSEEAPIFTVLTNLLDRQTQVRNTSRRDREIDWDFSLSIFPWKGRVYGMVFTDQPVLEAALFDQDWIEGYGYWDNCDRPDGISDSQWKARGRTWDSILSQDHASRPAGCGFAFEAEADFFHPSEEELIAATPSFDERVRHHAMNHVVSQHMKKQQEAFEGDRQEWTRDHGFRAAMKAMDHTRTEAGESEIKAASVEISAILSAATSDLAPRV